MKIISAQFIKGGPKLVVEPDSSYVVLFGRSNAGKSTFINRLAGMKSLARASATPGKTREILQFDLTLRKEGYGDIIVHLIDTPGYGYAKCSKEEKQSLQLMLLDTLNQAPHGSVIGILQDIRRDPEEDELQLRHEAFNLSHHVIIVLTKSDKLKRSELQKRIRDITQKYGLLPEDIIATGSEQSGIPFWEKAAPLLK